MPAHSNTSNSATKQLSRRAFVRNSFVATAGGGLWLSGCGNGADERSDSQAFTFLTALPLTSLTFAPELLADAGGYFRDQGLDVTFEATRGTAQAIQLVLARSAELTRIGQIEAMGHVTNRAAPIMNVGTVIKETTIRFVSSAAAPLGEPADFAGKVIGIPSEGGESEITLDLMLIQGGVDPAEVERQVVGVGPGVFNLVEQGRIAGYSVSIDTAKILAQQLPRVVVFNPGGAMSSGAQFYMASGEGVVSNEAVIRKYLEAIAGALAFMLSDDDFDETVRIMRTKYSFATLDDIEIARASLREYLDIWTSAGRENVLRTVPERWQRGYEELVRAGQAEPGHDPAQWFTNELLPAS